MKSISKTIVTSILITWVLAYLFISMNRFIFHFPFMDPGTRRPIIFIYMTIAIFTPIIAGGFWCGYKVSNRRYLVGFLSTFLFLATLSMYYLITRRLFFIDIRDVSTDLILLITGWWSGMLGARIADDRYRQVR